MAAGTTPERARMCLDTFAELHAAFWGWSEEQREGLFPARLHTYLAPGGRELTRALNASAIDPAHAAAPEIFTAEHAALCRRAIGKWDALGRRLVPRAPHPRPRRQPPRQLLRVPDTRRPAPWA